MAQYKYYFFHFPRVFSGVINSYLALAVRRSLDEVIVL